MPSTTCRVGADAVRGGFRRTGRQAKSPRLVNSIGGRPAARAGADDVQADLGHPDDRRPARRLALRGRSGRSRRLWRIGRLWLPQDRSVRGSAMSIATGRSAGKAFGQAWNLCVSKPGSPVGQVASGGVAFGAAQVAELTPRNATVRPPAMAATAKLPNELSKGADHGALRTRPVTQNSDRTRAITTIRRFGQAMNCVRAR
jgi:hypothetical protein